MALCQFFLHTGMTSKLSLLTYVLVCILLFLFVSCTKVTSKMVNIMLVLQLYIKKMKKMKRTYGNTKNSKKEAERPIE